RALRAHRLRRFQGLLIVTMAMGAIFLVGHALEYLKLSKELTPTSNAYGSAFYLITGLHAVHLTVGLVVLAYVLIQGFRGRYDSGGEPVGVQCGFLYWHFVDAVWIAVFSVLYLSERI
ncbi:MAG TPA: cytochrome c oxidase subunit 3, partial [Acidimicrobiales bacterium]|nr:cytochrome c oxidase subunit 3 [Acidimicrobiales bacterium]